MSQFPEPEKSNHYLSNHIRLLRSSYRRWTGGELADPFWSDERAADWLYRAPFALLSHGAEAEPVFNYANLLAQQLFGMDWREFTALPSRFSAEPVSQAERSLLLAQVTANGFIDHYQGVRISKSGKRFWIANAVVWNLVDDAGTYCGQAARFSEWRML